MEASTKTRVLLVDDEESLRRTLGDYLEFQNYEVKTAKNGEDALRVLEQFVPDVIVLDMAMPGIGGVGFLRRIMNEQGKPRHPVLVLTARAVMREFFDGIAVDGFIAKPSNEKDIVRELERILAESRRGKGREDRSGVWTVLLCEDEERRVEEIISVLEQGGYRTRVAASGPEALQTAMSAHPDVIVIKEILTGMNGSKVAGLLSVMQATRDIPVILYDSSRKLDESPLFATKQAKSVRKKLWTSNPLTIRETIDAVFATGKPVA